MESLQHACGGGHHVSPRARCRGLDRMYLKNPVMWSTLLSFLSTSYLHHTHTNTNHTHIQSDFLPPSEVSSSDLPLFAAHSGQMPSLMDSCPTTVHLLCVLGRTNTGDRGCRVIDTFLLARPFRRDLIRQICCLVCCSVRRF